MKIIDKYIFKNFISIFAFCTIFLYALFVIGDIFGFLDEILREHIGIVSLVTFYLNMMPFLITQIAPISCLLAGVFLLGNLNRHSEIVALKASGVSLIKTISTMLISTLVIGAFLFLLNDKVVPQSMRIANKIRYEKLEVGKRGSQNSIIMKNVALFGKNNMMIFAKEFDIKSDTLRDVIIHESDRDLKVMSRTSVKQMEWKKNGWTGYEVISYQIDASGKFVGNPDMHEVKRIDLEEKPLDFVNNQWQPQYMSYTQLKKYLTLFLGGSKSARQRFTVDLHYKLSFPFSCLIMVLIAAPFTLVAKRGKALMGMAKGILIALIYIPLVAVSLALGKGGILPPVIAAWAPNILLGTAGLYLTLKN